MKINNILIHWLVSNLLKNKKITTYLKEMFTEARTSCIPESDIAEVRPLNCRKSMFNSPRLNLLIPGLSIQHVFGGISTALSFFETIGKGTENLRIIIIDEMDFKLDNNPNYSHWNLCSLEDNDIPGFTIIVAGDRQNRTLSVGENDRFIATAWWTAIIATNIQQWQFIHYNLNKSIKFVYLIQDYEPGFYPWSSRYALAESTYHNTNQYIAVFNTGILKNFFDTENYKFSDTFVFEPTLHPKLRDQLNNGKRTRKERRIIIYGRPSTDRNAFQIIVMALKLWVSNNPGSDWQFISAGEKHSPVNLGDDKYLISLGKLTINEYAKELSKASIGISLMISPHPSYPPLEMAAFGVRTITNNYKGKDLSSLTPSIVSISSVNSFTLNSALNDCIKKVQTDSPQQLDGMICSTWTKYLESIGGLEKISTEIRSLIFPNQL
jgi:hypothetical protein